MPPLCEIQRRQAVEVDKLSCRFRPAIDLRQRAKQPLIGAIGNRRGQRRFVEFLDIGADKGADVACCLAGAAQNAPRRASGIWSLGGAGLYPE